MSDIVQMIATNAAGLESFFAEIRATEQIMRSRILARLVPKPQPRVVLIADAAAPNYITTTETSFVGALTRGVA
jgi:hypothetical protein